MAHYTRTREQKPLQALPPRPVTPDQLRMRTPLRSKRRLLWLEQLEERVLLATGNLDPRFGDAGVAVLGNAAAFALVQEQANAVLVLRDGDDTTADPILVAGLARRSTDLELFLTRLLPDGSTDATFGVGGVGLASFAVGIDDEATALAFNDPNPNVADDERIFVGGTVGAAGMRDVAVLRFDGGGTLLDQRAFDLGGDDVLTALVALADNSVIAVGTTTGAIGRDVFVLRLTPTGDLDANFDNDGVAVFDLGGDDTANDVAIQTSGGLLTGIFLAGATTRDHAGNGTGVHSDFALVRVTPTGQLDNSFGVAGITTLDFSGNLPAALGGSYEDVAHGVALVKDGATDKIVVAGKANAGRFDFLALARFNLNGTLDASFTPSAPTFGPAGTTTIAVGPAGDIAFDLAVQPNGRFAVAGRAMRSETDAAAGDLVLARFFADGSLDPTFGLDGRALTPMTAGPSQAFALDFGDNGSLIAAGVVRTGMGDRAALARYQADLRPVARRDSVTVSNDGFGNPVRILPLGNASDPDPSDALSIAQLRIDRPSGTPDDVVLRGETRNLPEGSLALSADGTTVTFTPASTFTGVLPIVYTVTDSWLSTEGLLDVHVLRGGARAGDLDTTFGAAPNRLVQVLGFRDTTGSTAVQLPGGDVVVAGTVMGARDDGTTFTDIGVARYNSDGSLDTSFGSGQGFVILDAGLGGAGVNLDEQARGVTLQRVNGAVKIVVAGVVDMDPGAGVQNDFLILRFNLNGTLDTSFNGTGIEAVSLGTNLDEANAVVAFDVDGLNDDLIVGGITGAGVARDFALVRLATSGDADNTFGVGGKVVTSFSSLDTLNALAIQDVGGQNKVIAVGQAIGIDGGGQAQGDFALARYDLSGVLDNGFDTDGKVIHSVTQNEGLSAVVVDGSSLVVAGFVTSGSGTATDRRDIAVARFLSSGAIDMTFGTNGVSTVDVRRDANDPGGQDEARSLLIRSSTIFVGGFSSFTNPDSAAPDQPRDFALLRFDQATGAAQGTTLTDFIGGNDQINTLLSTTGGILASGTAVERHLLQGQAFARYSDAGVLDASFAPPGMGGFGAAFKTAGVGDAETRAVLVQSNDSVLVGGSALAAANNRAFALARFLASGAADTTFGVNGLTVLDLGNGDDQIHALLPQAGDKFLAVGFTTQNDQRDIVVARFNADGSPDNTFDGDGRVVIDVENAGDMDEARGAVQDAAGNIYLTGFTTRNGRRVLAVIKLTPTGTLDGSFNGDGVAVLPLTAAGAGADSEGNAIALDGNRIVVAGTLGTGTMADGFLVRLQASGVLDPTFNPTGPTPGLAVTGLPQGDGFNNLAVSASGYVAVGFATSAHNDTDVLVARYLATGALDTTFGAADSGLVVLPEFGSGNDAAFGLALQAVPAGAAIEERLVISGVTQVGGVDAVALARLMSDGRRDSTFGVGGLVQTGLASGPSLSRAVTVDGTNRILAAGSAVTEANGPTRFAVHRYLDIASDNFAPQAVNDTSTTATGVDVVIPVLLNDQDQNGNDLTISGVTQPPAGQGTVTVIDGGKRLLYSPGAASPGLIQFTYEVTDGIVGTPSQATVTVEVVDPPRADQPPNLAAFLDALTDQAGLVTATRFPLLGGRNASGVYFGSVSGRDPGPDGFAHLTTGDTAVAEDGKAAGVDNANMLDGTRRGAFDATVLAIDINVPAEHNFLSFDFAFLTSEYSQLRSLSLPARQQDAFLAELDQNAWTLDSATGAILAPDNFAFDTTTGGQRPVGIGSDFFADRRVVTLTGTFYNAGTPFLRAGTPVTPGTHTLFLSIFDNGDGQLDSAAFVENLQTMNLPGVDATFVGALQAPVAGDDLAAVMPGQPVAIPVLDNDVAFDGGPPQLDPTIVQGTQGVAAVNGSQITYTPAPGFAGSDTFTYTVVDRFGQRSAAQVQVSATVLSALSRAAVPTGADADADLGAVRATLHNATPGSGPAILTAARYAANPTPVPFAGASFFDVQALNADATDLVTVTFNDPSGQGLFYFNGATWQPVVGIDGEPPTRLADGRWQVDLGPTSHPRAAGLTGTVFAVRSQPSGLVAADLLERFVRRAFADMTGKAIDAIRLAGLVGQLRAGASRLAVVRQIQETSAYRARLADRLARLILGRRAQPADLASLRAGLRQVIRTGEITEVLHLLVTDGRLVGSVQRHYLDRPPRRGERRALLLRLQHGRGLLDVEAAIVAGDEYLRHVQATS